MTLQSTHIERLSLLPSFPPLPLLLSSQTETTETGTKHDKTKRLLLANIPGRDHDESGYFSLCLFVRSFSLSFL